MTNAEKGFSLIEVLVAVAILAGAIMSVFTIYSQCAVELRRARNRTIMTNYAQQMMEMIYSSPYSAFNYHGLNTLKDPPAKNPIRADLLRWKSILETFPSKPTGAISVAADCDLTHSVVVTVTITYDNHGRPAVTTLALKIPSSAP